MADKDEPKWWLDVQTVAEDAVGFWKDFLGLRKGASHDKLLAASDVAKLLRIVRAVSWVESRHTHGSGGTAAVDPMQCGNPADAWWKALTGQSGNGDRFVRGPSLSNIYAKDLAAEAAKDAGFPTTAKLSSLTRSKDGHNDAKFGVVMSLFWGVPYLIHRMNVEAGDKTYQCVDLTDARVIAGAVAYNGGGSSTYESDIKKALTLIDNPVAPPAPFAVDTIDVAKASTEMEKLFAGLMAAVRDTGRTGEGRLEIFPHGLTSITFMVEAAGFKAELNLTGPSSRTS